MVFHHQVLVNKLLRRYLTVSVSYWLPVIISQDFPLFKIALLVKAFLFSLRFPLSINLYRGSGLTTEIYLETWGLYA